VNPDSTGVFRFKKLTKDKSGQLQIDSISYSPEMSLKEFSSYHGWRKSRNTIQVQKIIAELPDLRADSIYAFSKIRIVEPKVLLEKDFSYGLPDRKTKLPQEMFLALGITFDLDSLLVEKGKLEVKLQQKNGLVAELTLEDISANAGAQSFNQDSTAFHFAGQALALGGSLLKVQSAYQYGAQNPWDLSGSLADTDLEFLSSFLRKMAGVEISSGKLNELKFDMEGNNQVNTGVVTFLYDSLSIKAVDKETGEKKVVLNALADVLGALVFWKNNPKDGNVRKGNFSIERDVRKAFPSQWIDGLLAGVIESVAKIDPNKIRKNDK
ncbi:MAG TPA: hypothetical protein VJ949_02265, partial [Cryomorphaceae bacterium]|nr:hypothetical protein [Cryomorphaceae bacterium]